MKKIIVIVLALLCLCSCALRKTEEYDIDEIMKTPIEETAPPFVTEVEWIVEPCMAITEVEMMEAEPPFGYPNLEKIGHPQEWDYMAGKGPFLVDQAEFIGAPAYTGNAISVRYDRSGAIYDYDGNLLNDTEISYFTTEAGFAYRSIGNGASEVFSGDFLGTVRRNEISGLGGGYLSLFEYKGTLYSEIIDYQKISRELTGTSYLLASDDYDLEKDLEYRKATAADLFGHRAAVSVLGRTASTSSYDTAVYDAKGNRRFVLPRTEDTWTRDFTNGFLTVAKQAAPDTNSIRYAFYSVEKQDYITDFDYMEVLPFVEGYAAVKKDDRWAYINEDGELVTDFIWDDVSTMYDGRVYVGLKDRFGILDLKGTLEKGTKITTETCYGSEDPAKAYKSIAALPVHVPQQVLRDPDVTAREEEQEKSHKILGMIVPRYKDINIRKKPNTKAEVIEVLKWIDSGENGFFYPQFVYEIKEDDEYTWYRIGTDRWVADKGTWYDVQMYEDE